MKRAEFFIVSRRGSLFSRLVGFPKKSTSEQGGKYVVGGGHVTTFPITPAVRCSKPSIKPVG